MTTNANLPRLLQAFFTERLIGQRQASPHTLASYRDAFCLLLRFIERRIQKTPAALALADLDAPMIGAFLDHLEHERNQWPPQSQCALGRGAFVFPLCGAARAWLQRIDPTR